MLFHLLSWGSPFFYLHLLHDLFIRSIFIRNYEYDDILNEKEKQAEKPFEITANQPLAKKKECYIMYKSDREILNKSFCLLLSINAAVYVHLPLDSSISRVLTR